MNKWKNFKYISLYLIFTVFFLLLLVALFNILQCQRIIIKSHFNSLQEKPDFVNNFYKFVRSWNDFTQRLIWIEAKWAKIKTLISYTIKISHKNKCRVSFAHFYCFIIVFSTDVCLRPSLDRFKIIPCSGDDLACK